MQNARTARKSPEKILSRTHCDLDSARARLITAITAKIPARRSGAGALIIILTRAFAVHLSDGRNDGGDGEAGRVRARPRISFPRSFFLFFFLFFLFFLRERRFTRPS